MITGFAALSALFVGTGLACLAGRHAAHTEVLEFVGGLLIVGGLVVLGAGLECALNPQAFAHP